MRPRLCSSLPRTPRVSGAQGPPPRPPLLVPGVPGPPPPRAVSGLGGNEPYWF